MTWDQVKGAWKELRGAMRERWGKLTDSDLDTIAGQREQLVGAIQRQYGVTRAQVEEQVAAFEKLVAKKFESGTARKGTGIKRASGRPVAKSSLR
jgi:uncharacterized protein YjbJ (UPF0337 family)